MKKIITIFLIIICMLAIVGCTARTPTNSIKKSLSLTPSKYGITENERPITKNQYYGRSTLNTEEIAFYDAVYDALFVMQESIDVSSYNVATDRVKAIMYLIDADSPELFYFYRNYKITFADSNKDIVIKIVFNYGYSKEEAARYKILIAQETADILSGLSADMSEKEKVYAIYEELGKNIEYGVSLDDNLKSPDQTIIGGLVDRVACCGGITRTLQYLLYQVGVPCYYVEGEVKKDNENEPIKHAWNMIEVEGDWSYSDLTADLNLAKYNRSEYFMADENDFKAKQYKLSEKNPLLPVTL